jgi:small subunit ribosomal protein S14
MAKQSMKQREFKRARLIAKYAVRREEIKEKIRDPKVSIKEKMELQVALQKLPRDSSPSRARNRCGVTGRPHGYFRRFGLSRNKLRENAMWGNVPGIMKSSW